MLTVARIERIQIAVHVNYAILQQAPRVWFSFAVLLEIGEIRSEISEGDLGKRTAFEVQAAVVEMYNWVAFPEALDEIVDIFFSLRQGQG